MRALPDRLTRCDAALHLVNRADFLDFPPPRGRRWCPKRVHALASAALGRLLAGGRLPTRAALARRAHRIRMPAVNALLTFATGRSTPLLAVCY